MCWFNIVCRCAMKSMNKYLLLTSSAMIVARVASAALETDAKENKAVVNKLEFNRKYSELTPPSLVIPPFSSAKDYKRLAGVCFLGVGDCGGDLGFGTGDDYTIPCTPTNPCTGFDLTSTGNCADGYTSCNTGCETKYKCNPPQYTQTCEFPYQGVGEPKDGKYKECECQSAFKYGTGDCPSPKVPDTSGTSCDGKYASCTCPSGYTETCSYPSEGVGEACDGKYKSCQCPASYNRDCESEGLSGVGDACDGLYEDCTAIPCDSAYSETCNYPYQGVGDSCDGKYKSCSCPSSYTERCSSPYIGVGSSCNGLYESCTCPSNYNKTCDGQNPVGSSCNGYYSDCADLSCSELGYTESCTGLQVGVGESCDGLYKSCQCRSGLVSCSGLKTGVGEACDGKYESCTCRSDLVSCSSPEVGIGASCGGKYESCGCRSDLVSCTSPMVGRGASCGGKYASCTCPSSYNKTCTGNYVGVGETCNGYYAACECNSDFDEVCTGNQVCANSCGGKCSSCYVPNSGGSSSGSGSSSGGGGGGPMVSSYDDSGFYSDLCGGSSYC